MGIALGVSSGEIDVTGESLLRGGSRSLVPSAAHRRTALTELSSLMVGFRQITEMCSSRRRSAIGIEFAATTRICERPEIAAKGSTEPPSSVRAARHPVSLACTGTQRQIRAVLGAQWVTRHSDPVLAGGRGSYHQDRR